MLLPTIFVIGLSFVTVHATILSIVILDVTDIIAVGVALMRQRAIFVEGVLHVNIAVRTIRGKFLVLRLTYLLAVIFPLLYIHFTFDLFPVLVQGIRIVSLDIDLYILIGLGRSVEVVVLITIVCELLGLIYVIF